MNVTSRSDVGLMTVSPRLDASGVPVDKVAVPKTVQKPPSPHGDATGVPVGKVAVPMDLPRTRSGPRPADKCSDLTDWFRLLNVLYLRAQDNSETV